MLNRKHPEVPAALTIFGVVIAASVECVPLRSATAIYEGEIFE